ncbi:MAG: hypothetical protein LBC03_04870 [Nitrososphaerota archaeon]|jgi:hypothetical protein|nr:hypothetical protein [Nitrososphaerota archaeon]
MSEITNVQNSQDVVEKARKRQSMQVQIDKVEQIINQIPLQSCIAGCIGSGFLIAFLFVGSISSSPLIITLIGVGIWGGCMGYCVAVTQQAKVEYKKLIAQLNHNYDS